MKVCGPTVLPGGEGVHFPENKHCVKLEWSLIQVFFIIYRNLPEFT